MDTSLRTRTCPAWPGCGGGAPRRSRADHGAGRGVASGARLGSAVRSSGWPECPECRGGTMLGVVHFLRSFFKVRDVGLKAGFAGRVLLGLLREQPRSPLSPGLFVGWLRGTQERSATQSQLLDGCAGSGGGGLPECGLGNCWDGKEKRRTGDERLGRGELHRGWRDWGEPRHSWVSHGLGWVAG